MVLASIKNGNGWAVKVLIWIGVAAQPLIVALTIWLVTGQYEIGEQGRANTLAIKQINATLSERARADMTAATAERDRLRVQVLRLEGQQAQERETREAPGQPLPAQE